jgi:hypothetical protein
LFSPSRGHFFQKSTDAHPEISDFMVIRPLKKPEIVQKPQKSPPKPPFFIGNCLFSHKPVPASPSLDCFRRHEGTFFKKPQMPISKSLIASVIRPLKMPEIVQKPQKSPPKPPFFIGNCLFRHKPVSTSPSLDCFRRHEGTFFKNPPMPILKSSISSVIRPLKMPEIVQKPQKSPPKPPFFIGNCLFRHKPVSTSPSLDCFRRHQGAVERRQTFGDAPKLPETAGRQLGFRLAWGGPNANFEGFYTWKMRF